MTVRCEGKDVDQFKYDDRLGTLVDRLIYSFTESKGSLHLPDGCCCAMEECVTRFMAIDKGVLHITVYSGSTIEDEYIRGEKNEWFSVDCLYSGLDEPFIFGKGRR